MSFKTVDPKELNENFIKLISKEWMLVAAGNKEKYNMMTASWGSVGEMWGKDCALAVIRPTRYTYEFIDSKEYFTLSFYGDNRDIHNVCGKQSGRNVDKTELTGLTPVFDENSVYFEQARLVLVCKKLYKQEIKPECFEVEGLEKWYGDQAYHIAFVGEIVKALVKE